MVDRSGGCVAVEIHGAGRLFAHRFFHPTPGADPCRSIPRDSARGQTLTPITPDSALDSASTLCLLLLLLIPLAAAGLAIINTGLGRSRNAAHMMLASL